MSSYWARIRLADGPLRERVMALATSQYLAVYSVNSSHVEVRSGDAERVRELVLQATSERQKLAPLTAKQMARGRTVRTTLETTDVPVEGAESLRSELGDLTSGSTIQRRVSMERQIKLTERRLRQIGSEEDWLTGIIASNGIMINQLSLVKEEPAVAPATKGAWELWADQHEAKRKPSRSKQAATTFLFTRDHAQQTLDNQRSTQMALDALLLSLRQNLAGLPDVSDPVASLEIMLSKISGFTRFSCGYGAITGWTKNVAISGIAMGTYDVTVRLPPNQAIVINGGLYNTSGHNHPHVSYGRPCLGNIAPSVSALWNDHLYPMIFVLMWQYLNTWNAAGAYISMQALTGQTMRDEQNVRAQQMTMCPGSGPADPAHTIHVAEALTCSSCGTQMCGSHTTRLAGVDYCAPCGQAIRQRLVSRPQVAAGVST